MKLLAVLGSLLFVIYILVVLSLTVVNVSKMVFGDLEERHTKFGMRQAMIMIWPLACITHEGRNMIRLIWDGDF